MEELEQAFASLAKFLSQLQKRLFGPAPSASQGAQADTSSLVTSSRAPSMMPTGRFVESSSTSFWESSDKPEQESGNLLHPLLLDMRTATRKPRYATLCSICTCRVACAEVVGVKERNRYHSSVLPKDSRESKEFADSLQESIGSRCAYPSSDRAGSISDHNCPPSACITAPCV